MSYLHQIFKSLVQCVFIFCVLNVNFRASLKVKHFVLMFKTKDYFKNNFKNAGGTTVNVIKFMWLNIFTNKV